jgi:hypothetical protein
MEIFRKIKKWVSDFRYEFYDRLAWKLTTTSIFWVALEKRDYEESVKNISKEFISDLIILSLIKDQKEKYRESIRILIYKVFVMDFYKIDSFHLRKQVYTECLKADLKDLYPIVVPAVQDTVGNTELAIIHTYHKVIEDILPKLIHYFAKEEFADAERLINSL